MVSGIESITWGGSGIEKAVFDFIRAHVPAGSTVIELGAGYVSTLALSLSYSLYSVEHKAEFINKVEGVNYIYAPEVDGWYDLQMLEERLPAKDEQRLVLIDGLNREGILGNIDLFNPSALFIVHDTYRQYERRVAARLGKLLERDVAFHNTGDYWASI